MFNLRTKYVFPHFILVAFKNILKWFCIVFTSISLMHYNLFQWLWVNLVKFGKKWVKKIWVKLQLDFILKRNG